MQLPGESLPSNRGKTHYRSALKILALHEIDP